MENTQNAEQRKVIANEIKAKWGKFSDQELAGLKGRDDLVSQVKSRYKLDPAQAEKDVDTLLNGRVF